MAKRISTSRRSVTTNVKKSRQTFATSSTEVFLKQAPVEDLQDFSARSLLTYGTYVVEQRAIVAYNDGLKPVHRAILWAMYGLHLHNTSAFKKCARVVGETLGLYHPHGDASLYDALVGLVNSPTSLVEGYGDFGDHYCGAGASRYTESRLSAFSDAILLDTDYLAVTPMVDNYSGDRKMPLYLPAKLPIALLIGNLGIAFGVAASMPSFELNGVAAMTKRALQVAAGESKTPITAKECADTLKFKFKYGGNIRSQKSDIVNFMATGKGSLYFSPTVERIDTPKLKRYLIKSACPGFETKSSIDKTLEKIANLRGVTLVSDVTDKSGVQYNINLTKTLSGKPLLDLFTSIDKLLLKTDSYDIGLTARSTNTVKFFKTNVPDLLMRWAKWRLQLEKKMLANLALKEKEKLAKLKLIAHAISNLKIVVKALESSDPESYLMTNLGINQEQANYIRDLKFRQLEATDLNTVKAKIQDSVKLVNQYASDYKAPCNRIVSDLDAILNNKKILSIT